MSIHSCIARPFSRQIANANAGPASALESMGGIQYFRCNSVNIGLMFKQQARKSFVLALNYQSWPLFFCQEVPITQEGPGSRFSPIDSNAVAGSAFPVFKSVAQWSN